MGARGLTSCTVRLRRNVAHIAFASVLAVRAAARGGAQRCVGCGLRPERGVRFVLASVVRCPAAMGRLVCLESVLLGWCSGVCALSLLCLLCVRMCLWKDRRIVWRMEARAL